MKCWKLTEKSTKKNIEKWAKKYMWIWKKNKFNRIFLLKFYFQLKYQPIAKMRFLKISIMFRDIDIQNKCVTNCFSRIFRQFLSKILICHKTGAVVAKMGQNGRRTKGIKIICVIGTLIIKLWYIKIALQVY